MKLKQLADKKILILGLGKEGKDTFKFFKKTFPKKIFGMGDGNQNVKSQISGAKKVNWHLGKNYLKAL